VTKRPLTPTSGTEEALKEIQLEPPVGGFNWRIVSMPPEPGDRESDGHIPGFEADPSFDPDRPGMHRTDTLDLVQILEGEIDLVLEDDEVRVRAGDCIVQRGTWHAWRNRSGQPCVFSIVMLRSETGGDVLA
jgi:hypothetical protein